MKTKNGYKKLGIVQRANDTPRSYIVQSGNREYRRNRRDLLQSKEHPGNMHNEYFLEDYILLAKREENQENKNWVIRRLTPIPVKHLRQSTNLPSSHDVHRGKNSNTTNTNTLLFKCKLCYSKFAVDVNNWQNNPAISCMMSV